MTQAPAVSVLIKSYNHAPYIAETLESVLSQSFQDFEILVTDDASTDRTADVVRGFADPRIALDVLPVNMGVSLAMRSVLARARGHYVAILNSDDFALPGRLERQVAHLDTHPTDAGVFTEAREVDEEGRPLRAPSAFDAPSAWPDHGRARWLRRFFFEGNCLCAPSAMLRRDVLRQIGPHDPRLTNLQDLDLWVRLTSRHEIGFIPEPLTAFRKRAGLRNLSAPRPDTQLRLQFEMVPILRHYTTMPAALIEQIFAPDREPTSLATEAQRKRYVALRALEVPRPAYRLFALQTLFETAATLDEYALLRRLTGEVDVFNLLESPFSPHRRDYGARLYRLLSRLRVRRPSAAPAFHCED
jgi:glycosyltransferase involved in cell wall biosynthesis